jgi:hypothetical protein
MANENKAALLTASVQINKGVAFIGDLFTANSMTVLGMIQGRITITHGETFSDLTLSDQTGPEVLDSLSLGHSLSGSIPVVMPPDGSLIARVSTAGNKGIGYSNPQKPVETGLAIVPLSELAGGLVYGPAVTPTWERLIGNGYAAASGAAAAPKLSLFAWRVRLSMGDHSLGVEDGGLEIVAVNWMAMHSFNAGVPEGAKLAVYGDPVAFTPSISTFRFGSTTP